MAKLPVGFRFGIYQSKARRSCVPLQSADEEDVNKKVVVITGSNSGIGKEAATQFVKRGATVVMCNRDANKTAKAVDAIKLDIPNASLDPVPLDLGNLASVRACAQKIRERYSEIHILINNASVLYPVDRIYKTHDGLEAHMGVNHLGNFLFTLLLLDLVKAAPKSRIVFVGSVAHLNAELDLNDLMLENRPKAFGMGNVGRYANSKLANMYFARELKKRLDGTDVFVSVLCPGIARTKIWRHYPWHVRFRTWLHEYTLESSVEQARNVILYCSLSKHLRDEPDLNGQFFWYNQIWPGRMDLDDSIGCQLWEQSENLVGLKDEDKVKLRMID